MEIFHRFLYVDQRVIYVYIFLLFLEADDDVFFRKRHGGSHSADMLLGDLASGKHTKNIQKTHGKITMFNGRTHCFYGHVQ